LEFAHDHPVGGHLGFAKTYERIREKYFWCGLLRDVSHYVRSCVQCQRRKHSRLSNAGFMQPLGIPTAPFEMLGIDFFGPLPHSDTGNRYILVAVDYLTRYAEARAVPAATAEHVAQFFLDNIVLRHGAPRILLSDRGRQFVSRLVNAFLRHCNTIHKTTTSYHPQCNGLTERFNHTLA